MVIVICVEMFCKDFDNTKKSEKLLHFLTLVKSNFRLNNFKFKI